MLSYAPTKDGRVSQAKFGGFRPRTSSPQRKKIDTGGSKVQQILPKKLPHSGLAQSEQSSRELSR